MNHDYCTLRTKKQKGNRVRRECVQHGTLLPWESLRIPSLLPNEESVSSDKVKGLLAKVQQDATSEVKNDAERIAERAGVDVQPEPVEEDRDWYNEDQQTLGTVSGEERQQYDSLSDYFAHHTMPDGEPRTLTMAEKQARFDEIVGDEPESPTSRMVTVELPSHLDVDLSEPLDLEDEELEPAFPAWQGRNRPHEPGPLCVDDCNHDTELPPIPEDDHVFVMKYVDLQGRNQEKRIVFSNLGDLRLKLRTFSVHTLSSAVRQADIPMHSSAGKNVMVEALTRHLEDEVVEQMVEELEAELPDRDDHSETAYHDDFTYEDFRATVDSIVNDRKLTSSQVRSKLLKVLRETESNGFTGGEDIVWASFDGGDPEPMTFEEAHSRLDASKPHIIADSIEGYFEALDMDRDIKAIMILVKVWKKREDARDRIRESVMRQGAFTRDVMVAAVKHFVPDAHITTKTTKARLFEILTTETP